MPYKITEADPSWTFDPTEIERQVAQFAKNNNLTTQTAWAAFIATLTTGQSTATAKGLLTAVRCGTP